METQRSQNIVRIVHCFSVVERGLEVVVVVVVVVLRY